MAQSTRRHLLAVMGLLLLLAGCGGGGGGGGGGGPAPTASSPRYAYVANNGDSSVSTYVVDAATGRLKFIGTVAAGTGPISVTTTGTWQ